MSAVTRTWGPIITCIEAGHYTKTDPDPDRIKKINPIERCRVDGQIWPCDTMKAAKIAQVEYARRLAIAAKGANKEVVKRFYGR